MTDLLESPASPDTAPEPPPTRAAGIRAAGIRATLGGAAAMVGGLVIDGVQHAADPTLVERESLVDLGNIGHVLLVAGAGTVVAGLALAALGPALYGRSGPVPAGRRLAQVAAPVAVIVLLVAAVAAGSRSSSAADHHAGEDAAAGHDHPSDAAAADAAATPTGSGGHVHGEGPVVPLDGPTQRALITQLTATYEATQRYPTVADAEAAGLRHVSWYAPGSGAHYYKSPPPGAFDPSVPAMWLYAGNEPTSPVVGVMFYAMNVQTPPEGYAGPNDQWHQHNGLCLKNVPDGIDLPLPVDRDVTEEQCKAVEGRFMNMTGWMIHVWSAPGWESPQGVFSHDNPQLVCSDGKSAAEAALHVGCKGMA